MANKLVLYPTQPQAVPDGRGTISALLRGLGLTGPAFEVEKGTRYLAGERFLDHITFLGCSPTIQVAPPAGRDLADAARAGAFCHVSISPISDRPRLRPARHRGAPLCPRCRQPAPDCVVPLRQSAATMVDCAWRCGLCGHRCMLHELDWRRSAVFSRLTVNVWGVYPAEAVPGGELLQALGQTTRCEWRYQYTDR
jgi:hypothetical protein